MGKAEGSVAITWSVVDRAVMSGADAQLEDGDTTSVLLSETFRGLKNSGKACKNCWVS